MGGCLLLLFEIIVVFEDLVLQSPRHFGTREQTMIGGRNVKAIQPEKHISLGVVRTAKGCLIGEVKVEE